MVHTVKVERFHDLKDLYQNFDDCKKAQEFLEYIMSCMEEDSLIDMSFQYRGDKQGDIIRERHVFRASEVKSVMMISAIKGEERWRRSG